MTRNFQALLFRLSGKKMFNRSSRPQFRLFPFIATTAAFILFVTISAFFQERFDFEIAAVAVIPVISGSWYFGIRGGVLTTIFLVLAVMILRVVNGYSFLQTFTDQGVLVGTIVGTFVLILISFIVGRMSTVARERHDVLIKLEGFNNSRGKHTKFLEILNDITGMALEADTLDATLKILVEEIAKLFEADDCFFFVLG